MSLRLVVFDVDGTLVDSQGDIVAGMTQTFESQGRTVPERADIVATIGMSLPEAMRHLAPGAEATLIDALVVGYKDAYVQLRQHAGSTHSSPLFPGARRVLDALRAQPNTLLAVATGKSRRGLSILVEGHGLQPYFQSLQCADDHPSKPNPSMLLATLADTGVTADAAVMVGDTSFDRQMAKNAGVPFLGVSWGYHPASLLGPRVLNSFDALIPTLDEMWSTHP